MNTDKITYLNQMEIDTLKEMLNISMSASSSSLSMLLSNDVKVEEPELQEFENSTELLKAFKDNTLFAHANYQKSFEGSFIYMFKPQDAAVLADLMMGGAGKVKAGKLGDLQVSAVQEAINQMNSSIYSNLSNMFSLDVNAAEVELADYDEKNPPEYLEEFNCPLVTISFKLEVGDILSSNFVQVIPADVIKFQATTIDETVKISDTNKSLMEEETEISPEAIESMSKDAVTVQPVQFTSFDNHPSNKSDNGNIDLLMDIKLKLSVELGRTELPIKRVLELTRGSIIELDKVAGEPVELYANDKLIAKGEVVVIEDNFGLRITSIISPDDRIKNL